MEISNASSHHFSVAPAVRALAARWLRARPGIPDRRGGRARRRAPGRFCARTITYALHYDAGLGFVGGLGSVVETVVISGSLAYVGEYNTLAILDVSDPVQPVVLARMALSGEIKGVQVAGGLLYMANYVSGLQIIDVSDPLRPVLRGSLALAGNPSDIDVVDQRAYIPAYNGGLKIVDVTNPISPTLVGNSTESLGSVTGVKVVGDRAYIAGLSGLFIFDVSSPISPHLLGSFNSIGFNDSNGNNLDVIDTLAYL
ncbi:MAG: LVIVD repeat-containing protein, partial [Roseiflexaceae bacterium]